MDTEILIKNEVEWLEKGYDDIREHFELFFIPTDDEYSTYQSKVSETVQTLRDIADKIERSVSSSDIKTKDGTVVGRWGFVSNPLYK